MDEWPLPRGWRRKGPFYVVPSPPSPPPRPLDPEVIETYRRIEAAKIREYLERRKKRQSEGGSTPT